MSISLPLDSSLVIGLGITGEAVAAALVARGFGLVIVEDHPSPDKRARAELLGVELMESPTEEQLATLVEASSALFPSPGVPERHPSFRLASTSGRPVFSEFDLAAAWDHRPVVAVTGTNGKTTVTTMVTEMIASGGRRAVMAGNTELPLVAAIDDADADVFVVEASSFRLANVHHFSPKVATWLNFAADHLDVHVSLESYEQAKARIWSQLGEDARAIANADDPVVMRNVLESRSTTMFGFGPGSGFTVRDDVMVTDEGEEILRTSDLPRSLPHDVMNALAASATALAAGTPIDAVRRVLGEFDQLPHRVQLVADHGGIRWFDDSKATAPHAVSSAVRGFDSVVLIAGGRNKGLDLAPLAEEIERVKAVVAIGDSAGEVTSVFSNRRPVETADSMVEAVTTAERLAASGDVVLLSPGCASFDWYSSYSERGDDFAGAVRDLIADLTAGRGRTP